MPDDLPARDDDTFRLLRDGAAAARTAAGDSETGSWWEQLHEHVADLLDAEAVLHAETEPFVGLFSAALEQASGGAASLTLGLHDDGTPAMHADNSANACRLARHYLDNCGACRWCDPGGPFLRVCATCGNKRCPHATDHRHTCTGSNEPGQPGSIYGPMVAP